MVSQKFLANVLDRSVYWWVTLVDGLGVTRNTWIWAIVMVALHAEIASA